MAWTTPQTWTDGVIVSAATLNTHVRDNLAYLKGTAGVPYIENAIELPEITTPATPASGRGRLYFRSSTSKLYALNDAGVEYMLADARGARAYRSTSQSIATATATSVSFSTTRYDQANFWSAGNPTRLTVPETGTYMIFGHVIYDVNSTGYRLTRLRLNGTTYLAGDSKPAVSGDVTVASVATMYRLTASDYVELVVFHSVGASLNLLILDSYGAELAIARYGD